MATDAQSPWWLIAAEIDYSLGEPRKDLGVALGYGREAHWWLEKDKVEQLYRSLESTRPTLLTELDLATDEWTRKGWLDQVVAALTPQPAHADKTGGDQVVPAAKAAAPTGEAPKKRAKRVREEVRAIARRNREEGDGRDVGERGLARRRDGDQRGRDGRAAQAAS